MKWYVPEETVIACKDYCGKQVGKEYFVKLYNEIYPDMKKCKKRYEVVLHKAFIIYADENYHKEKQEPIHDFLNRRGTKIPPSYNEAIRKELVQFSNDRKKASKKNFAFLN